MIEQCQSETIERKTGNVNCNSTANISKAAAALLLSIFKLNTVSSPSVSSAVDCVGFIVRQDTQTIEEDVRQMISERLVEGIILSSVLSAAVVFQERRAGLGAVVLLTQSHRYSISSPVSFIPTLLSSSSISPPFLLSRPSWAASHLPLRLGAHSKCTGLG